MIVAGDTAGSNGPPKDHTLATAAGHYYAVESNTGSLNTPARLESAILRDSSASCEVRLVSLLISYYSLSLILKDAAIGTYICTLPYHTFAMKFLCHSGLRSQIPIINL